MKNKPSPFVQAALDVEETFSTLEQLAGSIERLELTSEASHNKARQLLVKFTEVSQGLQGVLVNLSQTLEVRRASMERAVQSVAERAPVLQGQLLAGQSLVGRYQALVARMQEVTRSARDLGPAVVVQKLHELGREAEALQGEAAEAKMRSLEREVQGLRKSLKAVTYQLEGA